MIPRPEDLDPESQVWIRALIERAPPLSLHQRERLELLFRADDDGGDAL